MRCLSCGKTGTPRYGRGGCTRCAGLRRGRLRRYAPSVRIARMLAAGQVPVKDTPGLVTDKWPSRCLVAGHLGSPTLARTSTSARKCERCARGEIAYKQSLPSHVAWARSRAALAEPLAGYRAGAEWSWRCFGCGRHVVRRLDVVRDHLGGCGHCRVASGSGTHQRLPADVALARALLRGQVPLSPWSGAGTLKPWRMRCLLCGHAADKYLGHLHQGVGICAACAQHGFDPVNPAEVYVVVNRALGAGKFGIGGLENTSGSRVSRHESHHWLLYRSRALEVGTQARRVEDLLQVELRVRRKIPPFLPRGSMRQSGETETFELRLCSAATVWELIVRFAEQVEQEAPPAMRLTLAQRRRTRAWSAVVEVVGAGAWPVDPYTGGSGTPWAMRCFVCGRSHLRRLAHVREGRPACPTCRRADLVDARRTPLPRAAALVRSGLVEPLMSYPGSWHEPWSSRCLACGGEVSPRLANIRSGEGGCRTCGFVRARASQRLDGQEASGRAHARGLVPLIAYETNTTVWPCRCMVCGHVSKPLPVNIFGDRAGCGHCERERLRAQYRTPQLHAIAVMQRAGWEPLEPYKQAHEPWMSRCLFCGKQDSPLKTNVQGRGSGARCHGRLRHRRRRTLSESE